MEIKITRSAKTCSGCERDFIHDETHHSRVRIGQEGLVREDFCNECWPARAGEKVYSAWSTRFYDPQVAEQEPAEVFSPLRQLFYEAVAEEDRLELAKAFLAAQLLRRQKVFRLMKESDEAEGEAKILLYVDRIGNRLIEVKDPNFSYGELDQARGRLLERLQELETPDVEEVVANDATN